MSAPGAGLSARIRRGGGTDLRHRLGIDGPRSRGGGRLGPTRARVLGPDDAWFETSFWASAVRSPVCCSDVSRDACERIAHGCGPRSGEVLGSRAPGISLPCCKTLRTCELALRSSVPTAAQELAREAVRRRRELVPPLVPNGRGVRGRLCADVATEPGHAKALLRRLAAERGIPGSIAWRPKTERLNDWLIARWISQDAHVARAISVSRAAGCYAPSLIRRSWSRQSMRPADSSTEPLGIRGTAERARRVGYCDRAALRVLGMAGTTTGTPRSPGRKCFRYCR